MNAVSILRVLLVCALLASSGCATMAHGTKQDVRITSTPSGATARIEPGGQTLTTPGETKLSRKNSYTVSVEHEGYQPRIGYIDREGSGAVWGNILLGGIIGLIVDYGNGAAYQLAPGLLHVDLEAARSVAQDASWPQALEAGDAGAQDALSSPPALGASAPGAVASLQAEAAPVDESGAQQPPDPPTGAK